MSKTHAKTVFELTANCMWNLRISGEQVTKIAPRERFLYDAGTQRTVPFCLGRAGDAPAKDQPSPLGACFAKPFDDIH